MMKLEVQIIVLVVLLAASAFFSALETAFYSINNIALRRLLKAGKPGARAVQRVKANPRRMIISVLIGNNIVNIAASAIATEIAIGYFGSKGVGIATGIMTFLILTFGEITPKNLASVYAEKFALFLARPLEIVIWILLPITYFFELFIATLQRLLGNTDTSKIYSEEELKTLVEIGAEEASLGMTQKEVIEGALQFDDITAKEVMTPRVKVFGLDQTMKIKDALTFINQEGYSRIPVYDGSIDRISGFVHIRDILKAVEQKKLTARLGSLAVKPVYTSQERVINNLFKEMQIKKKHLAVVVDEHGGTEGVVTIEDLLEELVGEIMDENDLSPELIMRVDKSTIIVHGDTEIDDVNHFFKTDLPKKGKYYTIAGLMHQELQKIPRKNAKVQVEGVLLQVLEEVGNKPVKVKLTKIVEN